MKGDIIKKLRLERGLTQKELADQLDVSTSYVTMLEAGERKGSDNLAEKVASFFNVSIDFLDGSKKSIDNELTKFLNILVNEGLIDDINNIDDKMQSLIMHYVKKEIEDIRKRMAQDND